LKGVGRNPKGDEKEVQGGGLFENLEVIPCTRCSKEVFYE